MNKTFFFSGIIILCASTLFSQIPNTVGWSQIPNTLMGTVCQGGANSCAAVITAWNSGVYDSQRHRLIIWGGGHGDYSGNEIYALNLRGTPTFERLNNTTAGGCSMESCDGGQTPNSRHTYDGIEYIPGADRMWAIAGAPAGVGWCALNCEPSVWTFNFADKTWKGTTPSGSLPGEGAGFISGWDPNTNRIIMGNCSKLFAYNLTTDTYVQLGSLSIDYHLCGVVDPKRKKFVAIGSNSAYVCDISGSGSADAVALTTTGGSAIVGSAYPGLAYDPVRDRIVAWNGGNTVYSLDMDTKVWTADTYTGGPGAAQGNGTYGRWAYSSALNAFVLVNSITQNAFVFRFTAGTTDNTPPGPVSNLAGIPASSYSVRLTWNAAVDSQSVIAEYIVKRNGNEVGRTSALFYVDTGLTDGSSYNYMVTAVNWASLQSSPVGPVSVSTPGDTVRPTITGVVVSAGGVVRIDFSEPVEAASANTVTNYTLDQGKTVQSAVLAANGKSVTLSTSVLPAFDYILTVNNVRDKATVPNTILPGTQKTLHVPVSTVLVDFGATYDATTYGLPGLSWYIKDSYNAFVALGPGGLDNADRDYSYDGVRLDVRPFAAPERIVATWYNGATASVSITPDISFKDGGRIVNGTPADWTKMTSVTIPVGGTGTTQYLFTTATAGSYSLVNIHPGSVERNIICDKIELLSGSGTAIETALPMPLGDGELHCFPNPLSRSTAIILPGRLKEADIRIYDVSGNLVWKFQGVNVSRTEWKTGNRASGVYLLKVTSQSKEYSKRILIAR
jgi:hypothetical protein